MTINYTTLLGLALPVTGTESGTWGDDVSLGITDYLDIAVAGTNNITNDSDITLSITNGSSAGSNIVASPNSTTAQYMQLLCTGSRTAIRNINCPESSKMYVVSNSTSGGYAIVVRGYTTGPSYTTGVTIANGEKCVIFWSSVASDFIKITSSIITNLTGTLLTSNGGTGLTSFTANGVVYASSTSALATGSALTFDGTNLTLGNNPISFGAGYTNLTVSGSSGGALYVANTANTGQGFFGVNNSTLQIGSQTNIPVAFYQNNTEGMRLTSIGLGIGTTSPQNKFVISNSGAAGMEFVPSYTGFATGPAIYSYNRSGAAWTPQTYLATSHYWGAGSNPSINPAMTLDSSGNLGLGVTPSAWNTAYKVMQLGQGGAVYGHTSVPSTYLTSNSYQIVGSGTENYIANGFAAKYVVNNNAGTHIWYNAPSGTAGNAITFTQALTLSAAGVLSLGDTGTVASSFSGVKFNGASYNGLGLNDSSSTSGAGFIYFQSNGTTIGSITRVGATSAVAYNVSSDYRLKNITGPITTSGTYIDSLNPVEGTWKADGSIFVGLIAHEAQESSRTQVATGTKDGAEMQSMDYSNPELIANLIAEVKSLRQRVATLEAK